MKRSSWFSSACALFLSASAMACGGSDADGSGSGDSDGPVSSSALSGSIAGTSFAAVSATASVEYGDDEGVERRIEIYDSEVTCETRWSSGGRSIILRVPWKDGFEGELLALGQTVTFYEPPGNNLATTTGRVEVISAPSADGERGTIRLRAHYDDDNQAEGEVEVEVCPKS